MANNTNEKRMLLFLSEDDTKTLVDALINAYSTADVYARSMTLQYNAKVEELEKAKKDLDDANRQLCVLDTTLNDTKDEAAEWKDKYMKLKEQLEKMTEKVGK